MRKALTVLLYIAVIALAFVNHIIYSDKLEQAKQKAYSEGYEAGYAALDLEQRESGKTFIDGYVKGLAEGEEKGKDIVLYALDNPDSIQAYFILGEGRTD